MTDQTVDLSTNQTYVPGPNGNFVGLFQIQSSGTFQPWNTVYYLDIATVLQALSIPQGQISNTFGLQITFVQFEVTAKQIGTLTNDIVVDCSVGIETQTTIVPTDPITFIYFCKVSVGPNTPVVNYFGALTHMTFWQNLFFTYIPTVVSSIPPGSILNPAVLSIIPSGGSACFSFNINGLGLTSFLFSITNQIGTVLPISTWTSNGTPKIYTPVSAVLPITDSPSVSMVESIIGFNHSNSLILQNTWTIQPNQTLSINVSIPNYFDVWTSVFLYTSLQGSGLVGNQQVPQLPFNFSLNTNGSFAVDSVPPYEPPVPCAFSFTPSLLTIQQSLPSATNILPYVKVQLANERGQIVPIYLDSILLQFVFFDSRRQPTAIHGFRGGISDITRR